MGSIGDNLLTIRGRMDAACARSGRNPADVELVVVSKTFPAEAVREAFEAGERIFGESRLQEALPKMELLPGSIHWHFIGGVQRNKVRRILAEFDVIHAVDSLRLARYVNEVASELGLFPKIFLQINVGGEATKGGFEVAALESEFDAMLELDRLEILGLMCIPPPAPSPEAARSWFIQLRELRDGLQTKHKIPLPCLSMGMSGDFEVAIEEGATHVRVGSSIFGNRSYRVDGELG